SPSRSCPPVLQQIPIAAHVSNARQRLWRRSIIRTLYGIEEFDGRLLLVMELVEGETLAERIARGPNGRARPSTANPDCPQLVQRTETPGSGSVIPNICAG